MRTDIATTACYKNFAHLMEMVSWVVEIFDKVILNSCKGYGIVQEVNIERKLGYIMQNTTAGHYSLFSFNTFIRY